MPDSRLSVFIGSTKEDLLEYRAAVREAVTELELFPEGMETWPVEDETAVDLCREKMLKSDIYVGFYAYRYGWQPDGYGGKSITEMEYDWATEQGKPRFCFIVDDNHPWAETKKDYKTKTELDAFKARVKDRIAGFFKTPDNLKSMVLAALSNEIRKPHYTRSIKCNHIDPPPLFAGRKEDIDRLETALSGDKAVAITAAIKGIGGIGKTTLARQFGHYGGKFGLRLIAELGQVYSEESITRTLSGWIFSLAGKTITPGMQPDDVDEAVRQIIAEAARTTCDEPVLVVIDDVWENTVEAARRLKKIAAGAHILITTRTEEVAAALEADTLPLEYLSAADGAELFIKHLQQAKVKNADTHRADLERLSAALGGHGLALNLVARQLRLNFSAARLQNLIATYERGLEAGDSFHDLELGKSDAASKIDSATKALGLTYDALGDDAESRTRRQKQFRALGALPSELAFRDKHLYAIWEGDDEDAINEFVAEGLLTKVEDKEDQYTQHRLLRAYARALLREANELADVIICHYQYLIKLAYEGFKLPRDTWKNLDEDLEQLHAMGNDLAKELAGTDDTELQDDYLCEDNKLNDSELDQRLLEICEHFAEVMDIYVSERSQEDKEDLIIVAEKSSKIAFNTKYQSEAGRRWICVGLTAAQIRGSRRLAALFSQRLARLHNQTGKLGKAILFYEKALVFYRELNDKGGEAISLNNVAMIYQILGHKEKALDYFLHTLSLYRQAEDKKGEATSLNNIGAIYDDLTENVKALDYFNQALSRYREISDKGSEAISLNNIGAAYSKLSQRRKALVFYRQALLMLIAVKNSYGEAVTRSNIAIILWEQGSRAEAMREMQTSHDLKSRIGLSTQIEDGWLAKWRGEMGGGS